MVETKNRLILVKDYKSLLDLTETQRAIKIIKDSFQSNLSKALGLKRVSAPLFVEPKTGLNDNLSGSETPVNFKINNGTHLEIVHSLAKWKRIALKKYSLSGLYTDMNAIRACENLDNIHSLYVDQWDWEKVITNEDRNVEYLKHIVNKIYDSFKQTYKTIVNEYPILRQRIVDKVTFITSEDLRNLYPNKTAKEREYIFSKENGAVFIIGIGSKLSDGTIHDSRAADYDDWSLNGDLLVYYDLLDIPFELSSMGIRVNKESLLIQLKAKNEEFKEKYLYHQAIINNELPLTIGGGIGQSRLCMFLLRKAHIGEVQASYWDDEDIRLCEEEGIKLL